MISIRSPQRRGWLGGWCLSALFPILLAAPAMALQEPAAPPGDPEASDPEALEIGETAAPTEPPGRETIAPWVVDVYGKNYEDFTNEGASRVISDWLTNALIDLDLFAIVNR